MAKISVLPFFRLIVGGNAHVVAPPPRLHHSDPQAEARLKLTAPPPCYSKTLTEQTLREHIALPPSIARESHLISRDSIY